LDGENKAEIIQKEKASTPFEEKSDISPKEKASPPFEEKPPRNKAVVFASVSAVILAILGPVQIARKLNGKA
jgi:hypothetical protein